MWEKSAGRAQRPRHQTGGKHECCCQPGTGFALDPDRPARNWINSSINCIRTLSIDAVQQAKSGHPGTPMALAPLVYTLWNRVTQLRSRKIPIWPNRDRFVLSNGHASMLLWSVLHLTGTPRGERRIRTARAARGVARRYSSLPPARQQGSGSSRIPPGFGGRGHHRPAWARHRQQRRHGHRREVARQPLQSSRASKSSTTTFMRFAVMAA